MKRIRNRTLAGILCLVLTLCLLPAFAAADTGDTVTFTGVVTYCQGKSVYLQHDATGVLARLESGNEQIAAGKVVTVSGIFVNYTVAGYTIPEINDAAVESIADSGATAAIVPAALDQLGDGLMAVKVRVQAARAELAAAGLQLSLDTFPEDHLLTVTGVLSANSQGRILLGADIRVDHVPGEAVEEDRVEATCTEAGSYVEVISCSVCGQELSRETKTIEALGHEEVIDEAVEPTCTETGLTEGRHCARCGEVLIARETVPACGHTPGDPVRENEVPATLEEEGSYDEVVYCAVCSAELSREQKTIDKLTVLSGTCGANLTWSLDTVTGVLTIEGSGEMNAVYSASGAPWREYKDRITSVSLPHGLTGIGRGSFSGCTGLTSISIPNTVTSIDMNAFSGCSGLTSISIPNSVTDIKDGAFSGCTGLTSLTIPNSIIRIEDETFWGCTGLTSLVIPNSVKFIGYRAFLSCQGLTSVTLPCSAAMDEDSFRDCNAIATVRITKGTGTWARNSSWNDTPWVVWDYAKPDPLTIRIDEGVCSIGYCAFYRASTLRSIVIPDSVTRIEELAFYRCTGLRSVTIPASVTSLESGAFEDCPELRDVYYKGTEAQRAALHLQTGDTLLSVTWHYKPDIRTQPKNIRAYENTTATIQLSATGAESYQWQWSKDGGTTWKDSTAATTGYNTATLQVRATSDRNGYKYRCKVSSCMGEVTSDVATLTVTEAVMPTITTQPKSVTAAPDTTASFTVVATDADGYQWQWSKDGGSTWTNCTSATAGYNAATLQVNTTGRNGYEYRCQVSNPVGTVTSDVATLTVGTQPSITTQPRDVTAASGTTATFTVAAAGTSLKYQWQWSKDGGTTWKDSSSATTGYNTATLQINATLDRNGYKYRCQVSNSVGTVTSDVATLTVGSKPTITAQPKSVTVDSGAMAAFTVAATNAVSYQWQWSKDDGATWKDSSSATIGYNTATLQVNATSDRTGYKYRCKVSNSYGTTTSSVATLTAITVTKPTITTQPKSVIAYVNKTAKFTVAASGNSLKYQWQWSKDGGTTWKDSSSATTGYNTATLQVSATADRTGYKYRCKVSNSAGSVTSSAATLTVSTKPVITTQPKSVTAASGATVKFTVAATGATGYQWQWSKDGGSTWTNCTSATTGYNTATLQVSTTGRNGYKYRCKVTNSAGTTTSSVATLTVK